MQDSVMHYSRGGFITQARTGKAAPRRPSANNPPGGIYPCKPGGPNDYVYLSTSRANPEHWPRLLKLIGREDLIDDERYATPDARLQREAEVDAIVTGWTKERTKPALQRQSRSVTQHSGQPGFHEVGGGPGGRPPGPRRDLDDGQRFAAAAQDLVHTSTSGKPWPRQ
jgi:hypothetical protein